MGSHQSTHPPRYSLWILNKDQKSDPVPVPRPTCSNPNPSSCLCRHLWRRRTEPCQGSLGSRRGEAAVPPPQNCITCPRSRDPDFNKSPYKPYLRNNKREPRHSVTAPWTRNCGRSLISSLDNPCFLFANHTYTCLDNITSSTTTQMSSSTSTPPTAAADGNNTFGGGAANGLDAGEKPRL